MSVFVLQGSPGESSKKIDYANELNQEQLDVVLNGDGPCLVLAGAGSGKTRTITYRVAYLLEQGIDPRRILLLTFTNKASREMLHRVSALMGGEAHGIWGGTFHSIANRLLRVCADEFGYSNRFTILDQEDAQSLLKAVMKELKIDPKARRFPTAAVVHNIISFATNTRTSVVDALELKHPNFVPFADEIEEIGRLYRERKRAANSMDFDDLLVNVLRVLEHPEAGKQIAEQFQYVLVDEYQDTNALQASIVKAVGAVHRNVLVVGDDAQSIYAFRGADVKNILSFPEEWPDARMFKLLTNYRSTPEILRVANESLSHNVEQFQKELLGIRSSGRKPTLVAASSARKEAQFIAEQVLALRNEGVALANIAVLFRSSSHSQALEFELMQRDIPYEYRGGMRFFERAHIKDMLAYLRIAANVKDEPAWLRVLNLQTGIGAVTATSLVRDVCQLSDIHQVLAAPIEQGLSQRARQGWTEFQNVMNHIVGQTPQPALMIRAVLDSGYRDYLEREYPDWRDRIGDAEQLSVFAENYPDVSAFVSDIALYDDVFQRRETGGGREEERMILSTIHQAKGLEWDTVFVIHLADTAFPNRRAMTEEGGLEEERRLFYVAVTRARRQLFLSYPLVLGNESLMLNQPSTFIEEIPSHLLERMELREARFAHISAPSDARRPSSSEWSWDDGYTEPAIRIDRTGNRTTPPSTTVWKKKSPSSDDV